MARPSTPIGRIRSFISTLSSRPREELPTSKLALVLNAPALLFMLFIIAFPLAFALFLSFRSVGAIELRTGQMQYVGLANFKFLFQDSAFWISLQHTVVFAFISVILVTTLGLAIALLINDGSVGISVITRFLVILPWAIPPIVNALIWKFIYNANFGFLNATLFQLGVIEEFRTWIGNPDIALYLVIIPYVWRTTPFAVILLHGALQGIPAELYEAAEIDGGNAWSKFWFITLPLLRPTLVVLLILRTSFAFMVFDEIYAITQGGPGNATWLSAWYTYAYSFQFFEIGIGAASAFVLAAIIGVAAFAYIRLFYREVEYA